MENAQPTRAESITGLAEQVQACLHSGHYSRALDLLRGATDHYSADAELSELEKLAHDGVERNAEAQRLITESQELFAQQKSADAIQLLRKAYQLDRNNSLARAILANALAEHAHSLVETDWLEAEKLTNQVLSLNPAHPTAKGILARIVEQKEKSSVEDWVSQASKLQSSGDLFTALAWVAEGLAVHPDDPKLLHLQDAIQRDRAARGRQTRRRDLEELRRMEYEIDEAKDVAAKQGLAERIQAVAVRYWADGEILAIANGQLQRLGLILQDTARQDTPRRGGSKESAHGKGVPIIFHVPRPSAPKPSAENDNQALTSQAPPRPVAAEKDATGVVPPLPGTVSADKAPGAMPETQLSAEDATAAVGEPREPAGRVVSSASEGKHGSDSNSRTLILIGATAAAIVMFAAISFFGRRHPVLSASKTSPNVSASPMAAPDVPVPTVSMPTRATGEHSGELPAERTTEPVAESLPPVSLVSSDTGAGEVTLRTRPFEARPRHDYPHDARAVHDQPVHDQQLHDQRRHDQPTHDLPTAQPQPQPQSRIASLTIQGGLPGTAVFLDQTQVGVVQPDGTLSVSSVNPGDHTVELRKEGFKTRQVKQHFVAAGVVSLAATEAALEAAPGELKITFTPSDANVAIVKGERLTMVNSGVPLNLAAGTYTLTARMADGFRTSSTLEIIAGQSKTVDLSLAPSGMSKWDDPAAWKQEKDSFTRKGGNFVLYGVPAAGTFAFSAMPVKGRLVQWVLNYTDPKNYVLFQIDDNNFYRTVIRNGEKRDEIIVPDKGEKKSFRALHIRVSPTEIVHQIRHGDSWTVLDRWTQPGTNLNSGKFGFYIPGDDQVALSGFAHYADLNLR